MQAERGQPVIIFYKKAGILEYARGCPSIFLPSKICIFRAFDYFNEYIAVVRQVEVQKKDIFGYSNVYYYLCSTIKRGKNMVHFRIVCRDRFGYPNYINKIFYYEKDAIKWIEDNRLKSKYDKVEIYKLAE